MGLPLKSALVDTRGCWQTMAVCNTVVIRYAGAGCPSRPHPRDITKPSRVNSLPAQQNYRRLLATIGEDGDGGHVYSHAHGQNVSSNTSSFQTQSNVFL